MDFFEIKNGASLDISTIANSSLAPGADTTKALQLKSL